MLKPRILIAEDNRADVELIQLALAEHGIQAELNVANRGDEAYQLILHLGKMTARPDLILMDLNLPGRTGIELLEVLRSSEEGRAIPVIVMTSSRSPADYKQVERIGITAFFRKPTDLEEFLKLGAVVKGILVSKER